MVSNNGLRATRWFFFITGPPDTATRRYIRGIHLIRSYDETGRSLLLLLFFFLYKTSRAGWRLSYLRTIRCIINTHTSEYNTVYGERSLILAQTRVAVCVVCTIRKTEYYVIITRNRYYADNGGRGSETKGKKFTR